MSMNFELWQRTAETDPDVYIYNSILLLGVIVRLI